MDDDPAEMSSIPAVMLSEQALSVISWLPGGHDGIADGVHHAKTAPATIIAVVERGAYDIGRADGRRATARTGEAFLAQEGEWLDIIHRADRRGGTMAACWVHFRVTLFGSLDACHLLSLPPVLEARHAAEVRRLIAATRTPAPGLAAAAQRAAAALAALQVLTRAAAPSPEGRRLLTRAARLAPLTGWVRDRLGKPIRLDDLAVAAGTSKSRLHARFQQDLGISPLAWVRELRLQAARDRLLATSDPVAEIGAACGFPDQFHFSRAVRSRFGMPPSELRKRGTLGPAV